MSALAPFLHYKYNHLYAPKLGRRANTFRDVFLRLPANPTIVETGMINDPGEWAGHGQSTILFDSLTKEIGGKLFSVDISIDALAKTRSLVSDNVILALGNSLNFLHAFNQPIDLLYLDSFDLDHENPDPAAKHQLYELISASKNLRPGSILLVDDTWWEKGEMPFGKGMLICDYMKGVNAERITKGGIQVGWVFK